jgi:poly(hydroxyalkanoate) granule-associated protein
MATSRSRTRKTAGSSIGRRVRDAFETAQETMQSRVGGAREQAQETWVNLEALFQSRVQRAMHQLGVPTAEEIRALTRRVSELNDSVSRIVQQQRAAQPRKTARPGKRKTAAAPRRAPAKRGKTAG